MTRTGLDGSDRRWCGHGRPSEAHDDQEAQVRWVGEYAGRRKEGEGPQCAAVDPADLSDPYHERRDHNASGDDAQHASFGKELDEELLDGASGEAASSEMVGQLQGPGKDPGPNPVSGSISHAPSDDYDSPRRKASVVSEAIRSTRPVAHASTSRAPLPAAAMATARRLTPRERTGRIRLRVAVIAEAAPAATQTFREPSRNTRD